VKLLLRPIGIITGFFAGFISKKLVDLVWGLVTDEDLPRAKTANTTWAKLIFATALEAVAFRVVRVVVDRAGAKGYERITGVWPGDEPSKRKR
jgi:hypothetical protein